MTRERGDLHMKEKDEITIMNIGWDYACAKLPEKLSFYASKGYILLNMDDRSFTLVRSEPQDISYAILSSDISPAERLKYEQAGWSVICECGKYAAYTAPSGTELPAGEKQAQDTLRRMIFNTVILLDFSAVILFLLLRARPDGQILSFLRSAAAFIVSGVFGFSVFRLISLIKIVKRKK